MEETLSELKEKLVLAHKALARAGVLEMNLGHMSVRLPGERALIVGHLHPILKTFAEITPEDLTVMDFEGNRVEGKLDPPGERFIHTAIYRARPNVGSVVHAHPKTAVAFSIANRPLVPAGTRGVVFYPEVPVYPKSIQIETKELGEEVARALGEKPAVLLKSHGAVSVGETIEQAFAVMTTLEYTAELVATAATLGRPDPIPKEEAEGRHAITLRRGAFWKTPWAYWTSQVRK